MNGFQSTLPRGERLYSGQYTCSSCAISIHAPARGATSSSSYCKQSSSNFNPRSREGSDHKFISSASKMRYFNPRSREGSDIQPTRNKRETADKFQSTLPRGERLVFRDPFMQSAGFQSTLPRGERRLHTPLDSSAAYFNPRSREGSDAFGERAMITFQNFNPRSREGSDLTNQLESAKIEVTFQSTLPRGERRLTTQTRIVVPVFQSTLPRGERLLAFLGQDQETQFQSTLPRGERLFASTALYFSYNFNPRSREGSDRQRSSGSV